MTAGRILYFRDRMLSPGGVHRAIPTFHTRCSTLFEVENFHTKPWPYELLWYRLRHSTLCGCHPIYSGHLSTPFGICKSISDGHTGGRYFPPVFVKVSLNLGFLVYSTLNYPKELQFRATAHPVRRLRSAINDERLPGISPLILAP